METHEPAGLDKKKAETSMQPKPAGEAVNAAVAAAIAAAARVVARKRPQGGGDMAGVGERAGGE